MGHLSVSCWTGDQPAGGGHGRAARGGGLASDPVDTGQRRLGPGAALLAAYLRFEILNSQLHYLLAT